MVDPNTLLEQAHTLFDKRNQLAVHLDDQTTGRLIHFDNLDNQQTFVHQTVIHDLLPSDFLPVFRDY